MRAAPIRRRRYGRSNGAIRLGAFLDDRHGGILSAASRHVVSHRALESQPELEARDVANELLGVVVWQLLAHAIEEHREIGVDVTVRRRAVVSGDRFAHSGSSGLECREGIRTGHLLQLFDRSNGAIRSPRACWSAQMLARERAAHREWNGPGARARSDRTASRETSRRQSETSHLAHRNCIPTRTTWAALVRAAATCD